MKTFQHLWKYLAEFFLEWEMCQTKVVEKIKIHTLYSITFSENRAVYEIMSKNMMERPQMTIWCRVACWLSKATRVQAHAYPRACAPFRHARTHARTEMCNTYCFSTATMVSYACPIVPVPLFFFVITLCRITCSFRRFEKTCCLHLQWPAEIL